MPRSQHLVFSSMNFLNKYDSKYAQHFSLAVRASSVLKKSSFIHHESFLYRWVRQVQCSNTRYRAESEKIRTSLLEACFSSNSSFQHPTEPPATLGRIL